MVDLPCQLIPGWLWCCACPNLRFSSPIHINNRSTERITNADTLPTSGCFTVAANTYILLFHPSTYSRALLPDRNAITDSRSPAATDSNRRLELALPNRSRATST